MLVQWSPKWCKIVDLYEARGKPGPFTVKYGGGTHNQGWRSRWLVTQRSLKISGLLNTREQNYIYIYIICVLQGLYANITIDRKGEELVVDDGAPDISACLDRLYR